MDRPKEVYTQKKQKRRGRRENMTSMGILSRMYRTAACGGRDVEDAIPYKRYFRSPDPFFMIAFSSNLCYHVC